MNFKHDCFKSHLIKWGIVTIASFWLYLFALDSIADSWALPKQEQYLSQNKTIRLTITPRDLSSQLDYFQDEVDGKKLPGQKPGGKAVEAHATLDRKESDGNWTQLWGSKMVNNVAPVDALVADSARYIVTFDDWHAVGTGPNAVAIYNSRGGLVRSLKLEDILPNDYIEALPHSVSSIDWRGDSKLIERDEMLEIQVRVPESGDGKAEYVEFRIRLADGIVAPPPPKTWKHALATAARVKAENDAAAAAWAERQAAPLPAPINGGDRDWYDFMVEAYFRLYPDLKGYPETLFLPAKGSANYGAGERRFVGWLNESFAEEHSDGDVIILSSPTPSNLANLLVKELTRAPAGSLAGVRLHFVGDTVDGERVRNALKRSLAEFVLIDIATPLPPRKFRQGL